MTGDLIIYAIIAAGLVFWLKSVLGTRHGDERERPNPFTIPDAEARTKSNMEGMGAAVEASPQDLIAALAGKPKGAAAIGNKTAEIGLQDIAATDRDFNIDAFLDGAQEAFAMIVEAFAKADRETLKDLLDPGVYAAFEGAITEREKRGETMTAEIQSIRKAEITEARLQRNTAHITIRFEALELTCTKDSDGRVVSGHPDKASVMRDVWVFARDIKSRDPRWFVAETRGDFDGDNETLPNAAL